MMEEKTLEFKKLIFELNEQNTYEEQIKTIIIPKAPISD